MNYEFRELHEFYWIRENIIRIFTIRQTGMPEYFGREEIPKQPIIIVQQSVRYVQATTLGTLAHFRHFQLLFTLGT